MSLFAKINDICKELKPVKKDGTNDFFKYAYNTERSILDAIRPLLIKHGLVVTPSVTAFQREGSMTTVELEYMITDIESLESIKVKWAGQGDDKADKGGLKALTGAQKSFLTKFFLIPTGDDPEADTETDKAAEAPATVEELEGLITYAHDAGLTDAQLMAKAKQLYKVFVKDLTSKQVTELKVQIDRWKDAKTLTAK